jgi:O-succinylbenzoic acid--CoA ligase
MIVPDWLHRQAAVHPGHTALVAGDERVTFAELERRADALARRVRATGARRVGVMLPNGPRLVELIHAVPRAGATLVLLDPRLPPAERDAQVALAATDLVVGPDGLPSASAPPWDPVLDLDAPHTVVFTSGTSGAPKPVVLTAGNHLWSAAGSAARLGAHPDDCWLACLPLWHVGGLAIVLRAAIYGATVVLQQGFDLDAVVAAVRAERVTALSLVPTALRRLAGVAAPPSLRFVLVGGAAASPATLRRAAVDGWPVAPTYGCTEAASQIATALPGTCEGVGHPLLPTRVRIVREDGALAAPHEHGVIEVQGPTVSAAQRGPDGWLRTNDIGALDDDGALHVLGRRDDVIVTGGENVAPAEVEAVLARLDGVGEVAVAGVDDAEWGRAVAAWIVPAGGAAPSLERVRREARVWLAPHKLPKRLFVVDALPRTAAGKVRRTALRVPHRA